MHAGTLQKVKGWSEIIGGSTLIVISLANFYLTARSFRIEDGEISLFDHRRIAVSAGVGGLCFLFGYRTIESGLKKLKLKHEKKQRTK